MFMAISYRIQSLMRMVNEEILSNEKELIKVRTHCSELPEFGLLTISKWHCLTGS